MNNDPTATAKDFRALRDYQFVDGVWVYVGSAPPMQDMRDLLDILKAEAEDADMPSV